MSLPPPEPHGQGVPQWPAVPHGPAVPQDQAGPHGPAVPGDPYRQPPPPPGAAQYGPHASAAYARQPVHEPAVPSVPIPQGPGVQPPFPAAPSEGRGTRIGWGVGVAVAALVLFCGGGLTALFGFAVATTAATKEQSTVVMRDYLDAIKAGKYDVAYKFICDSQQEKTSKEQFASREKARGQLKSYTIGEFDLNTGKLPVTESYGSSAPDQVIYQFSNDPKTAQLEICGRTS